MKMKITYYMTKEEFEAERKSCEKEGITNLYTEQDLKDLIIDSTDCTEFSRFEDCNYELVIKD